jgi:hypothetical protein
MFTRHDFDDTLGVHVALIPTVIAFASTLTTFDFAMKEKYTDEEVEHLTLAERPLFGRCSKNADPQAGPLAVPLITVNPHGVAGPS